MYRILKCLLEALFMLLIIVVCNTAGIKKYIIIILVSLLLLLLGRKNKWSANALICVALPVVVYLLAGGFSTLISFNAQTTAVKIMLFWLVPLFFSFALYVCYGENMSRIVDMQFISCCLTYAVPNVRFVIQNGFAESTFAFVFGAYLIYYAYKKRWFYFIIAAVLMYYSDKRIAMLAAVAALAVMGVVWIFRNHKKLMLTIWGAVSIVIILYVWLICSDRLSYICQGIGINTNGRIKMYTMMADWFGSSVILFGKGLGIVEKLLEYWKIYEFNNLHNDLLKFYIEIGIVGLFLYLLSHGVGLWLAEKKYGSSSMSLMLSMAIYSMVLFATDNVSIYIIYLIPVYSIYFAVLSGDNKEKVMRKT